VGRDDHLIGRQHGPLVVAHRGAWGRAPQNSLPALENAIGAGCEMVELDVRRTRDGKLVALHDGRVRGTPVGQLDYAELRVRLGPDEAPPLAEMVKLAAGRIALDVELKEEGYVEEVVDALAQIGPEAYVVTSFLDAALTAVKQAAPTARTGLLVGPPARTRRLEPRLRATGADFLAPHAGLARAGLLAWAANRGLDSYVWTVNDRRTLRTLAADARVAALITDRPGAALEARTQVSGRACGPPR
jgi:glycerophosphoryl diester phosphodiesterase